MLRLVSHDSLLIISFHVFLELDLGAKCVVDMDTTQTILFHPSTGVKER